MSGGYVFPKTLKIYSALKTGLIISFLNTKGCIWGSQKLLDVKTKVRVLASKRPKNKKKS